MTAIADATLARSTDEQWSLFVKHGRFPDRYCEGMERQMAEALWAGVLRGYPGLLDHGFRPHLAIFAGGGVNFRQSWAVGMAGACIGQARICAAIARSATNV